MQERNPLFNSNSFIIGASAPLMVAIALCLEKLPIGVVAVAAISLAYKLLPREIFDRRSFWKGAVVGAIPATMATVSFFNNLVEPSPSPTIVSPPSL